MDLVLCMVGRNKGSDVDRLRAALKTALGDDAATYPTLDAKAGTAFDAELEAAAKRWQSGVGIIADGVIGPRCQLLLDLIELPPFEPDVTLDVGVVSLLFPATKPANIARYLRYVDNALRAVSLLDRPMVLAALATIRAETEGFVPIAEVPPRDATGDDLRYRGRGFVQLKGKADYAKYGKALGVPLDEAPDLANAPEIAAVVLALSLKDRATAIRKALSSGGPEKARARVNGMTHGADVFRKVVDDANGGAMPFAPKPVAKAGTSKKAKATAAPAEASKRKRPTKTHRDAVDVRDRHFMPQVVNLPDACPDDATIADYLPRYQAAGLILDQGQEGACTGFGLACVVNYLRWVKGKLPAAMDSVSPRMLYTLARRYDEYAGENYEGSSCRGAIKGWFNNGVCLEKDWPYKGNAPKYGFAKRALENTVGVYYRIDIKAISDLQAAIAQHRAIFVSSYTHDGWDEVPTTVAPTSHAELPVIPFDGKPSEEGGHAYALVGFNAKGFILQNSWGDQFGAHGFAILTYADWLANGMDAWVIALGVSGVVAGTLAVGGSKAVQVVGKGGLPGWWDESLAYQHSVVLGNDGRVSRYLTEDEAPRKLQQQAFVLPDAWFRAQPGRKKRLVLYAHGGLNSESAAISRAQAMGRYFVGNGCYPLFLVWKTGLVESIKAIFEDRRQPRTALAGAGIGEAITNASDFVLEKTIGRPLARGIWSEMKENARLAFADRHGGELLLDALQSLVKAWVDDFELHVVGHSAGSIILGHLLASLQARRASGKDDGLADRVTSTHLYAPACSVAFANRHYASDAALMKTLYMDVLDDEVERDDNVATIYRKSLLYFVSNALEDDVRTPILGLRRIDQPNDPGWDGSSDTTEALNTWRAAARDSGLEQRTTVLKARKIVVASKGPNGRPVEERAAHGSFDNDVAVVGNTLKRIVGPSLKVTVDDLRGF